MRIFDGRSLKISKFCEFVIDAAEFDIHLYTSSKLGKRITMPTKRSGNDGTRKSSAAVVEPKSSKSMEPEIVLQNLSESSKLAHTAPEAGSEKEKKNSPDYR